MTGKGLALIVLAAAFTATANVMLREGVTKGGGLSLSLRTFGPEMWLLMRQPLFVLGVLLYGAASFIWFRIMSTENLNISYPLLVSLTFLLVTSAATLIFREPLSRLRILGLLIIVLGIVLTTRS